MKTKIYLFFLCLVIFRITSEAQEVAFEVEYDIAENTYYKVDSNSLNSILPQDYIKFLPDKRLMHKHETYFNDGTSKIVTTFSETEKANEDWLDQITKTIVYPDFIEVYKNDSLTYTEVIPAQPEDFEDPCTFSAYYLGTNDWKLPIDQEYIDELSLAGYRVERNDALILQVSNDHETHIYNQESRSETNIIFSANGQEIKRKVMFYKKNHNNHWLNDILIKKDLISTNTVCYEKTVVQNFSNINRSYYNEACKPPNNNIHIATSETNSSNLQICAFQLSNTTAIELEIPEELTETFDVRIRDIYGQPVSDLISISRAMPLVVLENVPTGVYSIHSPTINLSSCKFLFQP